MNQLMRFCMFFFLLIAGVNQLEAEDIRLPEWARLVIGKTRDEVPPARADAWILLDRTEFLYAGEGEIHVRRFRLAKVFTEDGVREGIFTLGGLGGQSSKVKMLKGWNIPAHGQAVAIERDDAFLIDPDSGDELTASLVTTAVLPGVGPGSIVAFESREVVRPALGPLCIAMVGGRDPILTWELEADNRWFNRHPSDAEIRPWNLESWSKDFSLVPGKSLTARNIPSIGNEGSTPGYFESRPFVFLKFLDDTFPSVMAADWQVFGMEWFRQIRPFLKEFEGMPAFEGSKKDQLRSILLWMGQNLSYKQVYLTASRGWLPEDSPTVIRRRGGDCKDLAILVINASQKIGIKGYPVLARIATGGIRGDVPVHPLVFNHMIAALALPSSFGLAAEVEVDGVCYLLVDPTDPTTSFGMLGSQFKGTRVQLCLPNKGQWVDIPDRAIQPQSMDIRLTAVAEGDGRVRGKLLIKEIGDACGLRPSFMAEGPKGLGIALFQVFAINPASNYTIGKVSDPLNGSGSFDIELELDFFSGLTFNGLCGRMAPIGIPKIPAPIQRHGQGRRVPIEAGMDTQWRWEADLTLPDKWTIACASQELVTALRQSNWKATAEEPRRCHLILTMDLRQQRWVAPHLDEGLRAVKEDRYAYMAFLDTCLGLRKTKL